MALKAIKTRIYPSKEQQNKIINNFGACRFVWNQLLEMQQKRYENGGNFVNEFSMNYLIKVVKQEYPFLKQVESTSLIHVSRDLASAYQRFFKKQSRFPKFKSRKHPRQSYQSRFVNKNICIIDHNHIKLPKLGIMPFKSGSEIIGKIKNVTIRKSATGNFYAILSVDTEVAKFPKTNNALGIDMGIADLMITSDGVKYPTIRFDKINHKKLHYWQKRYARRRAQAVALVAQDKHNKVMFPRELSDFKNVEKARLMIAKYQEKIANQRSNYIHSITKQLVEDNDMIVIEDLKIKNLLHNHKLARAIANASWREIRRQLEYKCDWYGKQLVIVNPSKTSQICSNCGYDDGKHTLDIRKWVCPQCHVEHDRDINAAKNILALAA